MASPTSRKGRTTAETKEAAARVEEEHRKKPAMSASDAAVREKRAQEVKDRAKGLTVSHVVQQLASLSTMVQDALAGVSKELTIQVQYLDTINEARANAEREVQEIHGKEILASSIADLIAQKNEQEKAFFDRLKELQDNATEKLVELEKEYARIKADKEAAWRREQEAYNYSLQQRRKQDEDQYQEERRLRTIEDNEKDRVIKLSWADREKVLLAKEEDYKKALEVAANLQATIKKETDAAVAIATNSLKKDLNHTFELERAELKHAISAAQVTASIATNQISDLKNQIARLEEALAESRKAQVELASRMVDGASEKRAFADLIALQNRGEANGPSQRKA